MNIYLDCIEGNLYDGYECRTCGEMFETLAETVEHVQETNLDCPSLVEDSAEDE
jgi:hypothetical protein